MRFQSLPRRRIFLLFSFCVALAMPAALAADTARPGSRPENRMTANGIAAIVEGRVITIDQVRSEMAPIVSQIQREARSSRDFEQRIQRLQAEVLRSMIDRNLIVSDFESRGARIPTALIESEYADFIRSEFNNDRARFLEYLRESGQTPRQFREDLRERIIVTAMRQQNRRSASEISPDRIEAFYRANMARFYQREAVQLRQITLMQLADEGMEPLRQTGRTIMRELESGTDFGDLARRFSQDEMRRFGGDYGWINRGDIRQELSDVAFGLGVGEYSQPIELGRSIFIVYASDRREERVQPLSVVREQIENLLADELIRETQSAWLERLRSRAHIQIFI